MKYVISFLLMLFMACNVSAQDYKILDTKTGTEISIDELIKKISDSQIVFFGEFHDDSLIHYLQYEFFVKYHSSNNKTALSMEMFERDVQNTLDEYLGGAIDEDEFKKKSRPWPDYDKFYSPLVIFSKEHQLPVITRNVPRKYAGQDIRIGMTGLRLLPPDEQNYFTKDFIYKDDEYKSKFFETMIGNTEELSKLSPNEENTIYLYYGSQCLKDETMAESIVDFIKNKPDFHIVHLNGDFHSNSYLGTVQKVRDRVSDIKLSVITPFYYNDTKDIKLNDSIRSTADFVIFVPEKKEKMNFGGSMGGNHFGENYIISHDFNVEINPEKSFLTGMDRLTFKNPILKRASVKLLKSLEIEKIEFKEIELNYKVISADTDFNEIIFENPTLERRFYNEDGIKEAFEITIYYEGKIYNKPSETNLVQRHANSIGIISAIDGEGIYLPGSAFYPKTDKDIAKFDGTIKIPNDYTVITSFIDQEISDGKYKIYKVKTDFSIDDLTIVGGKYFENKMDFDKITVKLFTYKSNAKLSNYLNAVKGYNDLYSPLFGDYPFKDFSIVENFFATGFGMPAYTLLSGKLLEMPWVTLSPGSLAHEFVHNWWGNSVFVDYEEGNWCEALTTFSTNYYLNLMTNKLTEAREWRKKALIEIDALQPEKNYPVKDFKYQRDIFDATIGYQKGAFIFIEVMKLMGEDAFFGALKNFATKYKGKRAFWFNLASEFDAKSKEAEVKYPIRKIFNSWISKKDIPELKLNYVRTIDDSIEVSIMNKNVVQALVPIVIRTEKTEYKENVFISDTTNIFKIKKPDDAIELQIDPDYELLRKVYNWEKPFNFNRTLNSIPIVVIPNENDSDYQNSVKFIDMLKESGFEFKSYKSGELTKDLINNNSIILLGNYGNNTVINDLRNSISNYLSIDQNKIKIQNSEMNIHDYTCLINIDHPTNPDKLCSVIYFDKVADAKVFRRLFHYMSYSYILVDINKPGKPILQGEILPSISNKSELLYKFR